MPSPRSSDKGILRGGGGIGNSRRRGQTRALTLCKHAVTTLVHETSGLTSTEHGLPRNWIFRLKVGIKYIGIVKTGNGGDFLEESPAVWCVSRYDPPEVIDRESVFPFLYASVGHVGIYSWGRNFSGYISTRWYIWIVPRDDTNIVTNCFHPCLSYFLVRRRPRNQSTHQEELLGYS